MMRFRPNRRLPIPVRLTAVRPLQEIVRDIKRDFKENWLEHNLDAFPDKAYKATLEYAYRYAPKSDAALNSIAEEKPHLARGWVEGKERSREDYIYKELVRYLGKRLIMCYMLRVPWKFASTPETAVQLATAYQAGEFEEEEVEVKLQ